MLVHGGTGVIYLVDWGSAVRIFGTALPYENAVHSFGNMRFGSAPACQQPSCHLYNLNPKMI